MPLNPSEEQQEIIECLRDGSNVITDSVAGSGKTTTILFAALSFPEKRIIVVTYNSRLKAETRERVKKNNIKNLEVHSYHSLGLQYYTNPCNTDTHLVNIIRHQKKPTGKLHADIFILDESQDMRKDYYYFLKKVMKDMNNPNLQLFVMGDHMQCIYQFLDADTRYLTLADKIFPSKNAWERCFLKTSYRITKPMEWFVNDVVLGFPRMKSIKDTSLPIRYYTGDPFFKVPQALAEELKVLFNTGYKPSDIFVLAPSIRSSNQMNPVKKFENLLVRMGIPCYVPLSDDEELRDDVVREKVVFSSFHQSKGLERKVVITMSFSTAFYFIFKEESREICPNLVYVSITRSSQLLYVWAESESEKPFPFLKHDLIKDNKYLEKVHCPSKKSAGQELSTPKPYDKMKLVNVSGLTRFLPEESVHQIMELCNVVVRKQARVSINIPSTIDTTGNKKESVSDLNGIAIPTIFEHRKKGYISIQNDLETHYIPSLKDGGAVTEMHKELVRGIQNEPSNPEDYLKLANIYSSWTSGYIHKVAQIRNYNWLTETHIEKLLNVLESSIHGDPGDMDFEETLELLGYKFNNYDVQLQGRADLIDDLTLWELKCVDSIKEEHIIQLALYAYIWQTTMYAKRGRRRFCVLNIRTGEVHEITGIENLKMVLDIVLDNAFRVNPTLSDEEFIAQCLKEPDYSKHLPTPHVQENCLILDDD
jgi:thymidine kinase